MIGGEAFLVSKEDVTKTTTALKQLTIDFSPFR